MRWVSKNIGGISHRKKQHITLYTFYKRTPAAVTPMTKSNIPGTSINNGLWVICSTLWWTSSAGSMIPLTVRGWSSSCFHPNLVPDDYSQFHSRWFFTETDGSSQMPKYRWERSEVGEKVKGGQRGGGARGLVTPLHHPCLGYAPLRMWPAAGWWGMKGAAVGAGLGAPVCLLRRPDSVPILLRTKRFNVCCIFLSNKRQLHLLLAHFIN